MTATRRCLLPDLADELTDALIRLEEALLAVAVYEEDDDPVPAPLAGERALTAVRRLWDAISPTQSRTRYAARTDEREDRWRLLAPDGRYEHTPLHVVHLDADDVVAVEEAVQTLGLEVERGSELRDVIGEVVEHAVPHRDDRFAPEGPTAAVAEAARLHGLLTLEWTPDAELLAARIQAAGDRDVVLDAAEERAYQRTVERINRIWGLGSPLDRFLY